MKKAKIIIDILMTALMFILMGMHLTGQMWHEIAGTALFVLFVVHHNNGPAFCRRHYFLRWG